MRVIVCGSRTFPITLHASGREALDRVMEGRPEIEMVIQGGANGVDGLARQWAQTRCYPLLTVWADWDRFGPGAGPIRNRKMIDLGRPDLVVTFPGGKGTADMLQAARRSRVEVVEVEL